MPSIAPAEVELKCLVVFVARNDYFRLLPIQMSTRFSLGIDLGTSNSAIALDDFESDQNEIVEITQSSGLTKSAKNQRFLRHFTFRIRKNFRRAPSDCHGRKPVAARSLAILPGITAHWFRIA